MIKVQFAHSAFGIGASRNGMRLVIQGTAKSMEKFLGSHRYYSLGYEKLTVHGLPAGDKAIVMTARKDLPLETVLESCAHHISLRCST